MPKAKKRSGKQKTKRSNQKQTVEITVTRKVLGKSPETYTFKLNDGRALRTVTDLVDELETMTEDAFRKYVTPAENHFANWIEGVFGDKHLAQELRTMHDRLDTQRAILKHIVRVLMEERTNKKRK